MSSVSSYPVTLTLSSGKEETIGFMLANESNHHFYNYVFTPGEN